MANSNNSSTITAARQQQQQSQVTPTANNLLSPLSALDAGSQQRRKSTLSGNGFFIDYSCTRRRSSAATKEQQQQAQLRNQLLRAYVSPVRKVSSVGLQPPAAGQRSRQQSLMVTPSSERRAQSGGRESRRSLSPAGCSSNGGGTGSPLLLAPLGHSSTVAALAGSRKTSIFDPQGHSLLQAAALRRKSTLCGGGGSPDAMGASAAGSSCPVAVSEAAAIALHAHHSTSTLSSVAKSAARSPQGQAKRHELVQHVPVIGCSPTSIGASLAALDETRRYEKLLRKLKSRNERREKRRLKQEKAAAGGARHQPPEAEASDAARGGSNFRRSSLKTLRLALNRASGSLRLRGRDRAPDHKGTLSADLEALSVSSLSFDSSACSSLPSLDRFELENLGPGARGSPEDELFLDEDTMINLTGSREEAAASSHEAPGSGSSGRKSLVRSAMRRLAATISSSTGQDGSSRSSSFRRSQRASVAADRRRSQLGGRRSISVAGNMNYWYYYYYLRENSADHVDELPMGLSASQALSNSAAAACCGSGLELSATGSRNADQERRSRLHVNYSLARIEILNSSSDPVAKLNEYLKQAEEGCDELELDWQSFSQSSLNLSTSSSTTSASSSLNHQSTSLCSGDERTSFLPEPAQDSMASASSSPKSIASRSSTGSDSSIGTNSRSSRLERRSLNIAEPNARYKQTKSRSLSSGSSCCLSSGRPAASDPQAAGDEGCTVSHGNRTNRQPSSPASNFRLSPVTHQQATRDHNSSNNRSLSLSTSSSSQRKRHSYNNLSVATTSSSHASGGSSKRPQQWKPEAEEEELDDFERLNRCHRGYKMSEAELRQELAQSCSSSGGATISRRQPAKASVSLGAAATGNDQQQKSVNNYYYHHEKTIGARDSGNRLSVRSARHFGRHKSSGGGGGSSSNRSSRREPKGSGGSSTGSHSTSGGGRNSRRSKVSMSWDTLTGTSRNESPTNRQLAPVVWTPDGQRREEVAATSGCSGINSSATQQTQVAVSTGRPSARSQSAEDGADGDGSGSRRLQGNENNSSFDANESGRDVATTTSGRNNYYRNEQHPTHNNNNSDYYYQYYYNYCYYCDFHSQQQQLELEQSFSSGDLQRARSQSSLLQARGGNAQVAEGNSNQIEQQQQDLSTWPFDRVTQSENNGQSSGLQVASSSNANDDDCGDSTRWRQPPEAANCPLCVARFKDNDEKKTANYHQGPRQWIKIDNDDHRSTAAIVNNRSNETPEVAARGAQVQLRARAHSTGAGSGGQLRRPVIRRELFVEGESERKQETKLSTNLASSQTKAKEPAGSIVISFEQQEGQQQKQQQEEEEEKLSKDLDLEDHKRKKDLLNKKSFACLVVGARQTGKQTIVKCFVKLVNEFRLAAFEYKREKMLTKLLDCSEQIQCLMGSDCSQQDTSSTPNETNQPDASELCDLPATRNRINSWLGTASPGNGHRGGGGSSSSSSAMRPRGLLNLPQAGKRRINSVVSAISGTTSHLLRAGSSSSGQRGTKGDAQFQQQRRHTTHDTSGQLRESSFQSLGSGQQSASNSKAPAGSSERYLRVESPGQDYAQTSDCSVEIGAETDDAEANSRQSVGQLLLPVPTSCHSSAQQTANNSPETSPNSSRRPTLLGQPHHLSPASTSGGCSPSRTLIGSNSAQQISFEVEGESSNRQARDRTMSVMHQGPASTTVATSNRRPVLSLKEMNKRRVRIRFRTRRQLSDRFFVDSGDNDNNNIRNGNAAHQDRVQSYVTGDSKTRASEKQEAGSTWTGSIDLPDSVLVVYSISDRDSFDYARRLIVQLRSIKQDTPMPIILVANKIDLERAKVVKSEEGRALASKNGCKFLGISCTVGFNLDNLLVGLRTQLILKHHITLNSIIRQGKLPKAHDVQQARDGKYTTGEKSRGGGDNILVRFYKRYLMDNQELGYDCDNFMKL